MKIIITESRLHKVIFNWLDNMYGDLKPIKLEKYPNQIFYVKEGEKYPIIDYRVDSKIAHVNHDKIWYILEKFFQIGWSEIQDILHKWLKERYDMDLFGIGPKL